MLGEVGQTSTPKFDSNMKISNLELIDKLVEESKNFPAPVIEYSFDLPKKEGITKDSFYGVKARFNPMVPVSVGATIIYKLS